MPDELHGELARIESTLSTLVSRVDSVIKTVLGLEKAEVARATRESERSAERGKLLSLIPRVESLEREDEYHHKEEHQPEPPKPEPKSAPVFIQVMNHSRFPWLLATLVIVSGLAAGVITGSDLKSYMPWTQGQVSEQPSHSLQPTLQPSSLPPDPAPPLLNP